MSFRVFLSSLAGSALLLSVAAAVAQPGEVEPNDNKTQATANGLWTLPGANASGVATGATTGSSTTVPGDASADFFRMQTASLLPGIYRHRLVITTQGTAGHTGAIMGLPQAGTPSDATTMQTSSTTTTPARMNQFYTFGSGLNELYYRVTGTTSTTAPYSVDYTLDPVTVTNGGSYQPGAFIVQTAGLSTVDTELFLFDSSFTQIGQNDDRLTAFGGGLQSRVDITLTPGIYYIAVSDFNTGTSRQHDAEASGTPFANRGTSGSIMDFGGVLTRSSTTARAAATMAVGITDSSGVEVRIDNPALAAYDVHWIQFRVVPEPSALALLAIGGLAFIRRR